MKFLGIIPARGGSKGLPRKNLASLLGKPLILYTIEAALESKNLDRVIVSTDDVEIKNVALSAKGVEVIDRPASLASDDAPTILAIEHVLAELKNKHAYSPDAVVLLQPTSPLRTSGDINSAIELFSAKKPDSVVGVCEASHSPYLSLHLSGEFLEPLFGWENFQKRRQDMAKTYLPNGSVYVSSPQVLSGKGTFYTDRTLPYVMPKERSIDIDSESDLRLAEAVLSKLHEKN